MTSKQFRMILRQLGYSQTKAAKVLGKSLRAVHGYANGEPIPEPVAKLLAMYVKHGIPKDSR